MHRAMPLPRTTFATLLVAAALILAACGDESRTASPADERLSLPEQFTPEPDRIVTGALDPQKLQAIAEADIPHVISLQPRDEHPDFDEAGEAKTLGIQHHHRPIAGADDLDRDAAIWLDDVLREIVDEAAVLHCASGNRVGALIALRAAWIEGRPTEAAIAEGKRWGLTSLENAVRERLSETN